MGVLVGIIVALAISVPATGAICSSFHGFEVVSEKPHISDRNRRRLAKKGVYV